MAEQQLPQEVTVEQITRPLNRAIARYEASSSFCCGGSLERLFNQYPVINTTHYGDFTSKRNSVKCAPITLRWDGKNGTSKRMTFDDLALWYRDWETVLEDLVQDCEPATFGFDDRDVLDEAVRKAGKLEAYKFSTNFNPYDYGIVQRIAQELLPGIMRAGRQPNVDCWGVIAELYKLNVYSSPSGMFKSHIDTPRGRTQFGSLVVCLPTKFQGGQLRVVHKDRERVFNFRRRTDYSYIDDDIEWAAFYSDCEHEVLPVTSGHRVTLTYQLYVSEYVGGLVQPAFESPDSKLYPLYRSIKTILASDMFMRNGGILGFHCAYRYPARFEGTEYYQRYPLTLKGTDAVLFTLFRAFDLTVHIKACQENCSGSFDSETGRSGGLVSTRNATEEGSEATSVAEEGQHSPNFEHSSYVGDEIFRSVTWFNGWTAHENGKEYPQFESPVTRWFGNETEIEWSYTSLALLVVVPGFSKRASKEIV